MVYLLVHVDYILTVSSKENIEKELMCEVEKDFEMKDLEKVKLFLGIEICKDKIGNFMISQ